MPTLAPPPAKRPVTKLAGPYGHPVHPAIVSVPLGAWTASFLFDVASLVLKDACLVQASRWLMGLGVLGAIAAAAFGFMDMLAIPNGTIVQKIALFHMVLNLTVVAGYSVLFAVRDPSLSSAPLFHVAASGILFSFLGVSGFLGGQLAYKYGVRVADEATQSEGYSRRPNDKQH